MALMSKWTFLPNVPLTKNLNEKYLFKFATLQLMDYRNVFISLNCFVLYLGIIPLLFQVSLEKKNHFQNLPGLRKV